MPDVQETLKNSYKAKDAFNSGTPHWDTILLVAPAAPPYGGMQLQAELLAAMLRADGFRVLSAATNPPFPQSLRFVEKLRGIRPFARAVLFCLQLWPRLAEAGVVHVMAASWLYFFVAVCPAVILGRLRRKRVVLTYHGGEAEQFLSSWAALAGPAMRMAHVITAPSGFLKQIIESRVRTPVTVVPNIVNLSAFRYRARSVANPKMLVTRHLEKIYDIGSVVRAFAEVSKRHPGASLWIAGTGSEAAGLRALVSELNLTNVVFLGHIKHEELPAIYDQRDIYLNASRADNCPGALLEASASGLVVVTTRAGGIPLLYEDRKNALFVDLGDTAALASAVERVLQTPTLARSLSEGGVALARQFQWSEVRAGFLRAYVIGTPETVRALQLSGGQKDAIR